MPPSKRNWEERTPDFFTFDQQGDEIEGMLVKVEQVQFQNGEVGRYTLRHDMGLSSFLGSTQVDSLLADVLIGTYIKLVYDGEIDTRGGRKMRSFKLYVDPASLPRVVEQVEPKPIS